MRPVADGSVRSNPVPIRTGTPEDLPAVLNVLDGGGLQTSAEEIRQGLERGEVFVATGSSSGTIVGAMVLDGEVIRAIAVRPARRSQGIGTALVEAGGANRRKRLAEARVDSRETLVATFHESVAPFWQSLEFDCERIDGTDRYRGVRSLETDR